VPTLCGQDSRFAAKIQLLHTLLSKLADLEPEIGDFVGNIASDKIFSKTGCPSWSKYAVQDKTL
jgi:hypothetical protein